MPHEDAPSSPGVVDEVVLDAATQLEEYFAGRRTNFSVRLHATGTSFHNEVWNAVRSIPYGAVASYGDIALTIGRPHAYRAVGNANNKNPWPVLIPCHRVVAAHSIGGYGGGLSVKEFLLELEGATWLERRVFSGEIS
jgi:O-6-methylguanine DNA methyltransferase